MDKYDTTIISKLAVDARVTTSDLSEDVHLSRPAVSRRVQSLEDSGVIKSYKADIDFEKLGWSVRSYIVLNASSRDNKRIVNHLLGMPEVLRVDIVSGSGHYIIDGVFVDVEHLRKFVRELQIMGDTETSVLFDRYHSEMSISDRAEQFGKNRHHPG